MLEQISLITEEDLTGILGKSAFKSYFSVYYCRVCFQTLVVSRDESTGKQADSLLRNKCPKCSESLSDNLAYKIVQAPLDTRFWNHPQINFRINIETEYPLKFTRACSLFGLTSQIGFIDTLIGGVKGETIALFKGSRLPLLLAERYCLRTQLPEDEGGFAGSSLIIDAGNSFDVYLFTSIAREYELDFDQALNKIIISRAFTPYELLQLVSKDAEQALQTYHPQLLVINDIFHLFTQDIEEGEAKRIIKKLGCAILKISRSKHIPIVITSSTRADYLEYLFMDYCNIEAEFSEEENQIVARLLKHPSKRPTEVAQELSNQAYNQQLLVPLRVISSG